MTQFPTSTIEGRLMAGYHQLCREHGIEPRSHDVLAAADRFDADRGLPAEPRFFIDSLSMTGEVFMIPSDRRDEWNDFDTRSEDTCEVLPIPAWAIPIDIVSHIEFSHPTNAFSDEATTDGEPA